MKILVVGGAGYVGGCVTDLLGETDHEFRVYDILMYEENYRKPVPFVYGDIRDHKELGVQLKWADAVIWLAAVVGDSACAINLKFTESVNRDAVQWMTNNFDGRIIFMSTCSVYGAQENELNENSLVNPLSIYAATKLDSEKFLEKKNAQIFRLGTLFGVGDLYARIRLDLVVNTLTVRAYKQGKLTIYGGDQFRPLLHVRDAAKAVVDAVALDHTGIFNLHKQNVRIIDLAYQVRNHFPDLIIDLVDMKFKDTRNYRVTSQKANDELGFNAQYSIDKGIEEVKELMETKRLKDIENPRYTNHAYLSMFNNKFESFNNKEEI